MLAENNLKPTLVSEQHDYETLLNHRNSIEVEGFGEIPGEDMLRLAGATSIDSQIYDLADELRPDPYGDGQRRRLYRTMTLYSWDKTRFMFDPVFQGPNGAYVQYFQGTGFNPDVQGKRRFAPIRDCLQHDSLLQRLVWTTFDLVPAGLIDYDLPVRAGIHLVRLDSDGRRASTPTPNRLHVDGEILTAVILIDRVNVTDYSARSYVAKRECAGMQPQDVSPGDLLAETTLRKPFDTLIVDDRRVSHSVSGVLGAGERPGHRTALLIDFANLIPQRTNRPRRSVG